MIKLRCVRNAPVIHPITQHGATVVGKEFEIDELTPWWQQHIDSGALVVVEPEATEPDKKKTTKK
jgi:hypothetical protein